MGHQKRCFRVKTPLGDLKVCAKHEGDTPEDFPGVYIDLVRDGVDILLACVEFNSCNEILQTCVYSDGFGDLPTDVIIHRNLEQEMD